MPEDYESNKAAFEKHMQENQGKEIDPSIAEQAEKEMQLGKNRGFRTEPEKEEPTKQQIADSYPAGELFKTDMSEQELNNAVEELTQAREIFARHINSGIPKFENGGDTTLFELEDILQNGSFESVEDLKNAMQVLNRYDFSGETSLFELPEQITESIKKYTTIAEHLHNKSGG